MPNAEVIEFYKPDSYVGLGMYRWLYPMKHTRLSGDLRIAMIIRNHLAPMRSIVGRETVRAERMLIELLDDEKLLLIARNSSLNIWNARPAYYLALAEELLARLRRTPRGT